MADTAEIADFRAGARAWIEEQCPPGARGPGQIATGSTQIELEPDVRLWLDRAAEKGWTAPTWPTAYGGGGLTGPQARAVAEELGRVGARQPLVGMGLSLIGPTLLEFATDDQKQRHIPKIVRGEVQWCQGYSEPGAGSDLAAVSTRAEDRGDHFLINGQKIWTSGGMTADWMFALVRTDPDAAKHDGISFVLFPMDQDGVSVRPIRLISGESPFCETFLTDVIAQKEDLVGERNRGWTIGKRLLQFERSGIGGLSAGAQRRSLAAEVVQAARDAYGEADGRIADSAARQKAVRYAINQEAFRLTARRVNDENRSGKTPGAATSIFKLYGATLQRDGLDLKRAMMGVQGIGAVGMENDQFTGRELATAREWLWSRTTTIYGGTNEVQRNIISKRVLGLPD